jgi:hypothetical protein
VNTAHDDSVAENESSEAAAPDEVPTPFVLQMRVSGGTHVRSIVHDLAHALGSVGHVVTLACFRQKDYALELEEGDCRYVPWEVFEAAPEDAGGRDADGQHGNAKYWITLISSMGIPVSHSCIVDQLSRDWEAYISPLASHNATE